jgi:hypothetical protein
MISMDWGAAARRCKHYLHFTLGAGCRVRAST